MPVLVPTPQAPVVVTPTIVPASPTPLPPPLITATWTSPDGSVWDLQTEQVRTQPGVTGIDSQPVDVTRDDLYAGGTRDRWSHAAERLIAWPLQLHDPDPAVWNQLIRDITRSFKATTPRAGLPQGGTLRITNTDSSWRELRDVVYLNGFDTQQKDWGTYYSTAVLSLKSGDGRFYSDDAPSIRFDYGGNLANYFGPHFTTAPSATFGTATRTIVGDTDTDPVWTIAGPCEQAVISVDGVGQFTIKASLAANQGRIVNVKRRTVTDFAGNNAYGDLVLPGSAMFSLPYGPQTISATLTTANVGAYVQLDYDAAWDGA